MLWAVARRCRASACWVFGALLLVALRLRRAAGGRADPPGWVFRRRLLVSTNLASLAVGAMLIGLTSYVPLYVQGVLGTSALVAGFALAALTIGWPIAARSRAGCTCGSASAPPP